jgi:glutamate-ammonia-ligase adenylyltransferase
MADWQRTLRLSNFAARIAQAHPELVDELHQRAARPFGRPEMEAALQGAPEETGVRLRRLRTRVMLTLLHRDLNGLAPLDEVFATMTALAETCVRSAAAQAHRESAAQFGEPGEFEGREQRLVVAALGKLGGGELNVSSDIDLVFLYGADGDTGGPRPTTHHEFFAHVGRRLIALLSDITDEGYAFRVDMRLRPFGSGALATSLAALEDYFIVHARPWERYAWLKARVIAGPGDGIVERVEPFVYRRYLDYGLLGSLRELHARIFETAIRRHKADDIKVGAGGIRAIEFAVQLFQLVRGGRDRGLRLTSTRQALTALSERHLIDAPRAAALADAYAFLRRLEHRLQYYDDQQTQALPRTPEHQAKIAEAMDFLDWGALESELDRHRALVQEAFDDLFEGTEKQQHASASSIAAWLNDPQASPDVEGLAEDLAEEGIDVPRAAAEALLEYTRSHRYRAMSASTRAKVEKLLPAMVGAAVAEGGRVETLKRLLHIIESIDRRDAYFSLLVEFPEVLARAARLVSRSKWASRLIARHPMLLDELTRAAADFAATDWRAERDQLVADCEAHGADIERALEDLRHFKQRHMLRLTIADLEGELPVMALSDELTALADTLLDVTLTLAPRDVTLTLAQRDVIPDAPTGRNDPGSTQGFIIVGYGKLGGKELGYASDLDIVFLYDGERLAAEPAMRIAQRVITWLTSYTPAGVLYETDLRLRPDGAKGVMVSSMAGFMDYQRSRAWTWEHQALTRARFCAGDLSLGERFERLRDEILATPRDRAKLLEDIGAMRRKMRTEQRRDKSEIKHIEGGVIDLEFCVQALVLAHGPEHPQLRENKGNHTLLKRMGELGLIPQDVAVAAADAYLAFRRRLHDAALNDEERVLIEGNELSAEREAVRKLWALVL